MIDEATLRSDFAQFDNDKNGSIDDAEFASLIEFLGFELSESQTAAAFLTIDEDQSGSIDFDEFCSWWVKYQET